MNIVVCIKQVPDVNDIKWTKENNLDRSMMLSKINLDDDWALDYVRKLKHRFNNVFVTAISMGPLQAKEMMSYSVAKCADRAILLSDKKFAASDTLATSKILCSAIKKFVPDFDLIVTGQKAQDGDTQQTPVSLAQALDIPDISNIVQVVGMDSKVVTVNQRLGSNINMFEINPPCLISVKEADEDMEKPKIEDYVRAQNTPVEIYSASDISVSDDDIGIKGSPTVVYNAYRPIFEKNTVLVESDFPEFILDTIARVCP